MKQLSIDWIAQAVKGDIINRKAWREQALAGAVIDSRHVTDGMLFVPIKGENTDGHLYIGQAFDLGAALVLTEEPSLIPEGHPAVAVESTRKAISDLAAAYRHLFEVPFIAITGSVGKTSTKEMTASILGESYTVHKTKGNYNNDLGVPLTLLGLEACHEAAVIEMGMDRFGEIRELSRLVKPTIGIITNIGVSHIEYLGSREGILQAKSELMEHLHPDGTLIICGDDPLLRTLLGKYPQKIMTYGYSNDCDCLIKSIHPLEQGGQHIEFVLDGDTYEADVAYAGEHLLMNAMAGALAGKLLGLDGTKIINGIKAYRNEKGRLNIHKLENGGIVIDDTYNATVDSMKSAVKTLIQLKKKDQKTVVVLGSMFEMGSYSRAGHREVGDFAAASGIDLLIAVGQEASAIKDGWDEADTSTEQSARFYATQEGWLEAAPELLGGGEAVLVKGSRGMHMEKTVEWLIEGDKVNGL